MKRILSLILLALLLCSTFACGGEKPDASPSAQTGPTAAPTEAPAFEPTEAPKPASTEAPAPTAEPTEAPTAEPTPEPTEEPTPEPTAEPTPEPETFYTSGSFVYVRNADGGATITGYTGSEKKLTIPAELDGYTVTALRRRAFYDNRDLTQVTVPDTVRSIGDSCFGWCTKLTSVSLPEGLESIGSDAFWVCQSLTKVNVPNSVTKIGEGVFFGCNALREITLAKDHPVLRVVDGVLFNYADSVLLWYPAKRSGKTYTVPDGTRRIGSDAFSYVDLEKIVLPESVEELGVSAFSACNRLKTICIPSKVTSMDGVIDSCLHLESIEVAENNPALESIDGVLFDRSAHALLLYPPVKKDGVYTVPEGTEAIGRNAFYSAKFTEINLPGSVRSIGQNAFLFCENIKEIVLPEGVEELSGYAFQYCTRLERIVLPDSLKTVGTNPFLQCKKLTEIVISADHPAFTLLCGCLVHREDMHLIACPAGLQAKTLEFPAGIRTIGTNAFRKCAGVEEIVFGEGLETIRDAAFDGCDGLKRIVLPASLTAIDGTAFQPDKLKNTVFVVAPGSAAESFCAANGLNIQYAG